MLQGKSEKMNLRWYFQLKYLSTLSGICDERVLSNHHNSRVSGVLEFKMYEAI